MEKEVNTDVNGQVSGFGGNGNGDDIKSNALLMMPSKGTSETPADIQISAALTSEQKADVRNLANEFPDVFTDKPGLTCLLEYEIRTSTETSIRLKP